MRIKATGKEVVVSELKLKNTFDKYDTNGDHQIDRSEIMSFFKDEKAVDALFKEFDTNKDGTISFAGTSFFEFSEMLT